MSIILKLNDFSNYKKKTFFFCSIIFGVTLINGLLLTPIFFSIISLFIFIYKSFYQNLTYSYKNELLNTNKIFEKLKITKLPKKNIFYTQIRHINSPIIQKDIKKFFIKFGFLVLIGFLSKGIYILYYFITINYQNQKYEEQLSELLKERGRLEKELEKELNIKKELEKKLEKKLKRN